MTSPEAARELLFGDVLACDEVRAAAFLPGRVDEAQLRAYSIRGEALLRALAMVEDGVRGEEAEPAADHALKRLEAKVDLLTALVAGLAGQSSDPARSLRWSARGARLAVDAPFDPGSRGAFRVLPAEWLPSPLLLPATVLLCEREGYGQDGRTWAWLRFDALTPGLEAALERHLFRIHRRAVAESRRPGSA